MGIHSSLVACIFDISKPRIMRTLDTAFAFCLALLSITACKKDKGSPSPSPAPPTPALTVTDVDGNTYTTVTIGSQVWMAENLRTTRYRDGTAIPNVTDNAVWPQLTTAAWCYYENNVANDASYGKLYNGYAAADPNICPEGWHLPSDAEWQQLEAFLGMPPDSLGQTGWRGAAENIGGQLKATNLWNAPNAGATNASGFSGQPGGNRSIFGNFYNLGDYGNWWSASGITEYAWCRGLRTSNGAIDRASVAKWMGFSVRCIKD